MLDVPIGNYKTMTIMYKQKFCLWIAQNSVLFAYLPVSQRTPEKPKQAFLSCYYKKCIKLFQNVSVNGKNIDRVGLCFAAMQEEVLKLVLLALEDGSALSRKVLVMFVVQRLEPHFPQASKTSIGHVVQLLYRASCFKVYLF